MRRTSLWIHLSRRNRQPGRIPLQPLPQLPSQHYRQSLCLSFSEDHKCMSAGIGLTSVGPKAIKARKAEDKFQTIYSRYVYDVRKRSKSELHKRYKTLSACQDFRVLGSISSVLFSPFTSTVSLTLLIASPSLPLLKLPA